VGWVKREDSGTRTPFLLKLKLKVLLEGGGAFQTTSSTTTTGKWLILLYSICPNK
jgi:hypothetical protein